MNKAYKFRAMPNAEQRVLFAKTVGCARFIYNRLLADKIAYYKETGKMLTNTPAQYKDEFPFLREVDSMALCNAYNEYVLKNSYVWAGNIPSDIDHELEILN